jgi:hypothetical protein
MSPYAIDSIVNKENMKKQRKVENKPNNIIILMFEKKLPLYILNPDANTIGGKQT